MAQGFAVDLTDFSRSLRHLSELNHRTSAENLRRYARTTLSNRQGSGLLEITPPGSAGVTGLAARRQGEGAIDRDLAAVFIPVRLKHKRRERWPDVAGIHDARFRSSSRSGGKLTRGQAQAYYVDVLKLRALRRTLFGRVGYMAAGWLPACTALGVRPPAWIARHGTGRGSYRQQLAGPRYEIEMVCHVAPRGPAGELERRVPDALRYATSRIEREIDYLYAKDAKKAGFKVG